MYAIGLSLAFLVLLSPMEELEGKVGVSGNVIRAKVMRDAQRPAEGVKIKLLHSERGVVVEGHTNSDGIWLYELDRPGEYEVAIQQGNGSEMSLPITIKPVAMEVVPESNVVRPCCRSRANRTMDWSLLGPALFFLGSAALILMYFRRTAAVH